MLRLFDQAMSVKIPHNVFAAWMVGPLPAGSRSRPVDMLDSRQLLQKFPGFVLAVHLLRTTPPREKSKTTCESQ